ncbi:cmk-1 [Symbiodinium natans]|uniref:Cmk-1 protein n=1 Tax=Symbiodinium natans TaxID=878477 RepID=A0A812VCB0_9DINO|nr:cmk-1 [Symbiodinium natans]
MTLQAARREELTSLMNQKDTAVKMAPLHLQQLLDECSLVPQMQAKFVRAEKPRSIRGIHSGRMAKAPPRACELLWPVRPVLRVRPIEFHAVSVKDGGDVVDHQMSLSRAQFTLILDVLAENICYTGRSGSLMAGTAPTREPAPTGGNARPKSRGFRFSWRWPGELNFHVSFTEAVPLGCLRLREGMLGFSSSPTGTVYELKSSKLTAVDLRTRSRNVVKTLLECVDTDDETALGFSVEVNVPVDVDTLAVIQLQHPRMHVLPQLVMDLVTAGLSAWQHCTFRNDRASAPTAPQRGYPPGSNDTKVADKRGTRVQVNFLDGCFAIAEKWAEPTEHFEFAGSVLIHILVHAEGIRIERFDLESGALRLRSARRSPTTLCPCLEWSVRGDQRRVDDGARMKRHTQYDLRSVIVPPYAIRMSARDHRAMANSLLELLSMDAESAEPPSETQSRDPLALQLVENRLTLVAEIAIEGAEVQVLGEEGGNEWPGLCANARCQLLQLTVDNRQGASPTINLFGRELEVDISSRNHRLGLWEPVLPRCCLRFSYHAQRKPDGGPRDVVVRADVAAIKPVKLVISAPFVHLASQVFKESVEDMQYGHLLAGVNISGLRCLVRVDSSDSLEGVVLPSSAEAQPLDSLLKGRGRVASGTQLSLELRLPDHPDADPCRLQYGREVDVTWDTKTAGFLMCRLVMPRPPQLVLLITSTVCVWNKTPADLEIRFLAPGLPEETSEKGFNPIIPQSLQICADARLLTDGVSPQTCVPAEPLPASTPDAPQGVGDGAVRLRAGQLLSAPTLAQLRMGQAVLQIRPAFEAGGGVSYKWSEQFFAVPVANPHDTTLCSAPPTDMEEVLPHNRLSLRTSCGGNPEEGWCNVEVYAPFTVINACPCDVLCQFNPQVVRKKLGKERERLPVSGNIELLVDDGFGHEVPVPKNGQVEIMPFRLDDDGCLRWTCNGQEGRTKSRWQNINAVIAVLNCRKGEVEWHCLEAKMNAHDPSVPQLRIAPQSMLPAFDFVAEELTVSFAVRDQHGHASSWSLPLRAVQLRRSTEVVQLEFKGMWINLNAMRNGRELIVYTALWFVNSTGLDIRLLQPGGPGPMHPVAAFGSKVSILPEIRNDAGDGVAFVGLRSHAPIEANVPDVSGAVAVAVTPLHPCCLRTETVALPEAMRGVPSCLVSLLPAMMLFNHTEGLEVGFRQHGCPSDTAVWVPASASRAFWWHSVTDQLLQVAVRFQDAGKEARTSWSQPFELKESRIGAYPVTLKAQAQSSRFLVCVCIDFDAASWAVTIKDSGWCHTLVNKHPDVQLIANMEGVGEDPAYTFGVAFGEQLPIGGRGPPSGNVPRLRLTVQRASDADERATVFVDLNRSGVRKVPRWSGRASGAHAAPAAQKRTKSTLRVNAAVVVALHERVAVVTVMPDKPAFASVPRQLEESGGEEAENDDATILRTFTGELKIDTLRVGLVVEGPSASLSPSSVWDTAAALASSEPRRRHEVFTINLNGVQVSIGQTPDRCRDVDFQIWDIQVDMQYPRRDVVLKSTSQPALRTHTRRDDVRELDVHLREVKLAFGPLEVSVTGALMDQVRFLRRNLTVGTGGLTFDQVLIRAKGALHLSNPQPPGASSKLVVNKLAVGDARVDVWCQLHLPDAHYLPKSLRDTIQVVSLGTTRLDVKGAQVKLPQQVLFSDRKPAEGNFGIVASKVWVEYLPLVKACWRSLLQHSNIFLGGLLSRHTWNPRQRREWHHTTPLCHIGPSGELRLMETG